MKEKKVTTVINVIPMPYALMGIFIFHFILHCYKWLSWLHRVVVYAIFITPCERDVIVLKTLQLRMNCLLYFLV